MWTKFYEGGLDQRFVDVFGMTFEQAEAKAEAKGKAEGKAEGLAEGKTAIIRELVLRNHKKGASIEDISDILDIPVEEVYRILEEEKPHNS